MPQDKAQRYNRGKSEYSLLDLKCLEPCVKVLMFGAKKYSRDNWKKGLPQNQILDSLLRHLGALLSGEQLDLESGISHIGHIQANALFLGNKNNSIGVVKKKDHSMEESIENDRLYLDRDSELWEQPVSFKDYDISVALGTIHTPLNGVCAPNDYVRFRPEIGQYFYDGGARLCKMLDRGRYQPSGWIGGDALSYVDCAHEFRCKRLATQEEANTFIDCNIEGESNDD